MRNAKIGALIIAVIAGSSAASAAIDDPDRVQNGLISGVAETVDRVRVFKGIPFAAPPVGHLRWREPQPVADWAGGPQSGFIFNNLHSNAPARVLVRPRIQSQAPANGRRLPLPERLDCGAIVG